MHSFEAISGLVAWSESPNQLISIAQTVLRFQLYFLVTSRTRVELAAKMKSHWL